MGIIAWIVFGFFTGLVARALMPGSQKFGFVKTTLLGVGGSFAGGAIASLIAGGPMNAALTSAGFIGSVIGAILLLVLGRMLARD